MNFGFITRRPLWLNILFGVGLSIFLLIGFLFMLNQITNHGEYLVVPEVKGKDFKSVQSELENLGFDVVIQDSIYIDSIPPNTILKQFPEAESTVKVNRVVYLTVNCSVPPTIVMPNLVGMSLRNALLELRSLGLKLGDTTFVPDIAKNAVKDQLIGGVVISPGSPIQMGSRINLVIGGGLGVDPVPVPDLFGLTYEEAKIVIEENGIGLAGIALDDDLIDTSLGYIYWQKPNPLDEQYNVNMIRPGQLMDIKLGAVKPDKKTDSIQFNNQ
jgi:beta-lactam-binding protein with PASTA domain